MIRRRYRGRPGASSSSPSPTRPRVCAAVPGRYPLPGSPRCVFGAETTHALPHFPADIVDRRAAQAGRHQTPRRGPWPRKTRRPQGGTDLVAEERDTGRNRPEQPHRLPCVGQVAMVEGPVGVRVAAGVCGIASGIAGRPPGTAKPRGFPPETAGTGRNGGGTPRPRRNMGRGQGPYPNGKRIRNPSPIPTPPRQQTAPPGGGRTSRTANTGSGGSTRPSSPHTWSRAG